MNGYLKKEVKLFNIWKKCSSVLIVYILKSNVKMSTILWDNLWQKKGAEYFFSRNVDTEKYNILKHMQSVCCLR